MMSKRSFSRAAVALLALSFGVPSGMAQKKAGQDPTSKPHNEKPELKKAYKDWLDKDVTYIITDEERKAWKKLATDDERERFIEEFWRRRDPDPDTDENEFKEEYYERIAYANEHFASGMPGWKSDRGRIWIMYGKPDERETHPSGGNYERPSYEGGGNITAYPFETWVYRHLDGVGDGVEVEFVDRTSTGEYKIARDIDEKNALATTPIIRTTENSPFLRHQDEPLERNAQLAALETPPKVRFRELEGVANSNSGVLDKNPLAFD